MLEERLGPALGDVGMGNHSLAINREANLRSLPSQYIIATAVSAKDMEVTL